MLHLFALPDQLSRQTYFSPQLLLDVDIANHAEPINFDLRLLGLPDFGVPPVKLGTGVIRAVAQGTDFGAEMTAAAGVFIVGACLFGPSLLHAL